LRLVEVLPPLPPLLPLLPPLRGIAPDAAVGLATGSSAPAAEAPFGLGLIRGISFGRILGTKLN
jgi:hypothetical protein